MKELFSIDDKSINAHSELGRLREISLSHSTGCGMRVASAGKSGFAFASSPKLLPKDFAMANEFYGYGGDGRALFNDSLSINGDKLIGMVRAMLLELDGVNANFVGASFGSTTRRIKNPHLSLSETTTQLSVQAFVSTPTSVGFDYVSSRKKVAFKKAARRAKEIALASQDPARPKVGRMLVTLRPKAVSSFVNVVLNTLSATEVLAGRSVFADRIGETVSTLKIVDDPLKKTGIESRGFDDEGSRCRKSTLIDGELKQFLHTIETAERLGGRAGNATRSYSSLPSAGSTNTIISGPKGNSGELVVDWVSGAHMIAPSGDFAVEAKNAFQNGSPVSQMMLCGNVFDMLRAVRLCGKRETFGSLTTRSWTVELDVVA